MNDTKAQPIKPDKTLKTRSGSFDIEAVVHWVGRDLLVSISGGEVPHIGAVAAAHPRPSLKDPRQISATASVICYTAHKEDDLAKHVAETLAATLNTRVVVTAGIHWDNLSEKGIHQIVENSRDLVALILKNTKTSS
jgi:hypothetical protein